MFYGLSAGVELYTLKFIFPRVYLNENSKVLSICVVPNSFKIIYY